MLEAKIVLTGETQSDLEAAAEEVVRLLSNGNTSGYDNSGNDSLAFTVSEQDDPA